MEFTRTDTTEKHNASEPVTIRIRCPHCQAKFKTKSENEGKKAKCKKCGQAFVIDSQCQHPVVSTFRDDQNAALRRAALQLDIEGVRRHLAAGADVNSVDEDGYTVFMAAVAGSCRADTDMLVSFLNNDIKKKRCGAASARELDVATSNIMTDQFAAIRDLLWCLKEAGADVSLRNKDGLRAIDLAPSKAMRIVIESVIPNRKPKSKKPSSRGISHDSCAKCGKKLVRPMEDVTSGSSELFESYLLSTPCGCEGCHARYCGSCAIDLKGLCSICGNVIIAGI